MPLPTLPDDEKQKDTLNLSQQNYDDRFNSIAKAHKKEELNNIAQGEEQGTFDDIVNNYDQDADSTQEDTNINNGISKLQEDESQGSFKSNYTGEKAKTKSKTKSKTFLRRAAPAIGVGGTFTIFGIVLVALTTPSLLIVQMKEVMTSKFNTQLSSMDTRSNKLLLAKVAGATSGVCSKKIAIACKYSSLNDNEVQSLKKAGFTFEGETKGLLGRTTVTGFIYEGETINAKNFPSKVAANSKLRAAFKEAYNPKYAGFVGKAWSAVATKYKISKQAPDLGADEDPEKAKQKLQDIAKEGMTDNAPTLIEDGQNKDPTCTGNNCEKYNADEAKAANATAATYAAEGKSGASATKVKAAIDSLPVAQAGNLVKVTGIADSACTAIGALNTLTYAAKSLRVLQLVRYMMVFSSVADSIKAGGNPKPEDVSYLGTILTSTAVSTADTTKTTVGSATDSYGYKYAAYGDSSAATTQSMNIANRFMAGGGMVGDLAAFSNTVYGFFGAGNRAGARDAAHTACGVLANPIVQGVSLLVGIGALFIPGVDVATELTKAAFVGALSVGIAMIPDLVSDIVAGSVTDGIVGEESGDAIASGYGSLLSDSLAGQNGAAPMSKADTIAYNNDQTSTTDQYIADELQDTSPFDATNPHTFVGSIVATLMPLKSQSNPLASVGSLLSGSLKSIIPTTKAASNDEYAKSLDVCQDPDAIDGKFAVDPFCNVIRGIPPQYINRDPIDVAQTLYDQHSIDADGNATDTPPAGQKDINGNPMLSYAQFIKQCMTSDDPLGYSGSDFVPAQAQSCVINDTNANYYLNYMDNRVQLGMDGEDTADATSTPSTTTDKKALAQKIVAKNKVTYAGDVQPVLDKIADGSIDPNAEPCGINLHILQLIDTITDQHSITISDMNRMCIDVLYASGTGSRHYAGNGSAIDIAKIDGVATDGRDANAISIINLVSPMLSQYGTDSGSYSSIGQSQCGTTPPVGPNVKIFEDDCSHLHLDVPPKSDPNLKYDPSGW